MPPFFRWGIKPHPTKKFVSYSSPNNKSAYDILVSLTPTRLSRSDDFFDFFYEMIKVLSMTEMSLPARTKLSKGKAGMQKNLKNL